MIEGIVIAIVAALLTALGFMLYNAEKARDGEREYDGPIPDADDPQYWEENEYGFIVPPGVTTWKIAQDFATEKEHFELEDLVHVVNPYNGEFLFFEDRELTRPGVYEVFAIVRDPATNLYRYKLTGLEGYFGHDWLLEAEAGPMVMDMPEADRQLREAYEKQIEEYFVKKDVSPEIEEALYEKFVDDVFDRINSATSIEEKTALLRLLEESRNGREGSK